MAVETVYKHFGNKRALTREVLDVAIAGDDEPVAMVDRAEAQAIASADGAHEMVRLYARYVRGINERMGPLHAVLFTSARAGEPDLQQLAAEADEQRPTGARIFARLLISTGETHPDLEIDEAADIIWAFNFHVTVPKIAAPSGSTTQFEPGTPVFDDITIAAASGSQTLVDLQAWIDDAAQGLAATRDGDLAFNSGGSPVVIVELRQLVPTRGLDPFAGPLGDQAMQTRPGSFELG